MSAAADAGCPHLDAAAIAALPVDVAAEALGAALGAGLDPEAQPERETVAAGEGELLIMPGIGAGHAVVKAIAVAPQRPRIRGLCVLFDLETLAPVATLDGAALTLLRTAAVSALAVRLLAIPGASRLLVFGTGPQARAHAEAIGLVRPIQSTRLVGRGDTLEPGELEEADVICCCTTATEPLFAGELVADRACVVAIGSHTPEARETDDRLAARATVVVESRRAALREAGDVIAAVASGAIATDDLVTLSELVTGAAAPGPGPRLFKSVGMGWQDAVVATAVVARWRGRASRDAAS